MFQLIRLLHSWDQENPGHFQLSTRSLDVTQCLFSTTEERQQLGTPGPFFPEVTDAFLAMMDRPCTLTDTLMETIERFVVLMYERTSVVQKVDEARQKLFAQQGRLLENIPPTSAALRQHLLRAIYQAGHVWGQCLVKEPVLPSPAFWGWKQDGKTWKPV